MLIEERRKYIRLDAEIDFTYKIKGVAQSEKKSVTENIGPGGISGLADKHIKKGDWLELNIHIATLEKPIFAIGKVIWTADEKAGKICVGIKFEEIDAGMKNKFLEYMCELMFHELERTRG